MEAPSPTTKTIRLPSGEAVPAFGLGTWRMGEQRSRRREELAIIRYALDRGIGLIDTAEMYGNGGAEEIIGEAIQGRRDDIFLVSKVWPHNASRKGVIAACERSLKRLGTERIDLYLLHWPSAEPIAETLAGFAELREAGKIRHYGVSNFDAEDLDAAWHAPHGHDIAANQLLYNLSRRGIEWDTLPWMRERGVPVMAYSPLEQARLLDTPALTNFARAAGVSPAQAALSWLLAQDDMIVIPKTVRPERLEEDLNALERPLTPDQLTELDRLFPPPTGRQPLDML